MQLFPEFNYCIKILFCLFSVVFLSTETVYIYIFELN